MRRFVLSHPAKDFAILASYTSGKDGIDLTVGLFIDLHFFQQAQGAFSHSYLHGIP